MICTCKTTFLPQLNYAKNHRMYWCNETQGHMEPISRSNNQKTCKRKVSMRENHNQAEKLVCHAVLHLKECILRCKLAICGIPPVDLEPTAQQFAIVLQHGHHRGQCTQPQSKCHIAPQLPSSCLASSTFLEMVPVPLVPDQRFPKRNM